MTDTIKSKTEVKIEFRKHINNLIVKAAETHGSEDALKFAEAAKNIARAEQLVSIVDFDNEDSFQTPIVEETDREQVLTNLREAIQAAEQFGIVYAENEITITGAVDTSNGIVLTS